MKIYIDVYFFVNFTVDLVSLTSASRLLALPRSRGRLLIAALFAAAWSVSELLFQMPPAASLAALFLSVYFVTYKKGIGKTLLGLVIFIGAELFIGGASTVLMSFGKGGMLLAAVIILSSVLLSEAYTIFQHYIKRRLETLSLTAHITHRGRSCALELMVDSGNMAYDTESGMRVLFVDPRALKIIHDTETLFEREKCYVIPIVTASGRSAVNGFVPDRIEFSDKKYNGEKFIVVPDMNGSGFGGYDGIAPLI